MDKVGKYSFMAEPFHCDFSGQLFMGHLGNHMLNAADFHSSARGFGMQYLMSINRSWVLSRLAIEMTEMPQQYTKFNVETWVESAMRYFTSRNFAVIGFDGESKAEGGGRMPEENEQISFNPPPSTLHPKIYGYGRSIWAMIDTETRQPTDIYAIDNGAINNWIVKDKECPIDKGGRVKVSDDAQLVRTIETYYNDVDINGHINSVKYIEHVLDLWPLDWYRNHAVKRFEIAYVAEAHAGDKLSFYMEEDKGGGLKVEGGGRIPDEQVFCIRIVRTDGTECCRSKVAFIVR